MKQITRIPATNQGFVVSIEANMSISENQEFDVEKILEDAKRFSERIYTFFRFIQQPLCKLNLSREAQLFVGWVSGSVT